MLKINNIEVMYHHSILVLKGVSLEVKDENVVALLGANGAGKTTTLKTISGILKAEVGEVTDGTIELDGIRIDRLSTEEIVRLGVTLAMEGRRIFEHLTVEENLRVGRKGGGIQKDLDIVYSYFPRLKNLRRQTSGFLSGGEQQMLVIGAGLMAHPRYLLLDEPSLGLSPLLTEEIFKIIGRIKIEAKTSILLVEQNAIAALNVADYGYVMENGKVVLDGPAEKLKDNEDVKEFYLGLSQIGGRKSYKEVKHYRRRKRWLG
ncbi:MAG: ABC transporter ATP-binding protein [Thermodesulfobacteriota bacterium]|jgi:branched-chain amino acid transport system ATP-binding protein